MFVLDKERLVWWPVKVEVPVDGGETKTQEFEVCFKLVPVDDPRSMLKTDRLKEQIVAWRGVSMATADGGARELAFSAEHLATMLAIPYAHRGLVTAFVECQTGAKRKNSERPPAGGPAAAIQPPATMQ